MAEPTLAGKGCRELRLVNGGQLILLPEAAALEPQTRTLLIADAHLGKAESFRRQGVPVPVGTSQSTLDRLSAVIERWQPRQLVFLGDLIHDHLEGNHPLFQQLADWRDRYPEIPVYLIQGNHDRKAGPLPSACRIQSLADEYRLGPLSLMHEPRPARGELHAVAGHIHPVVRLSGRADSARLRCFWARPGITVLPAFGEFTGGHRIVPGAHDELFVLDGVAVHKLPVRAN